MTHWDICASEIMIVGKDMTIRPHHNIVSNNGIARNYASDSQTTLVTDFQIKSATKVCQSLDIDVLSTLFEYMFA